MHQQNFSKSEKVLGLKVETSPILVVNNSKFKPYIEHFSCEPANMVQSPLGNLVGFFKINNLTDDSAYIVNFLSSVVKKEYYINPKRSAEASFDLALHKANVALSELAKNGNINWIGNLDSAVCAVVKDNFYFSVTGNAKIILLRDNAASEISEGLAEENSDPHPIKTYTNVSSGPLLKNDKIIITSDDIFSVFSLAEIKKNAARFPPDKFSQFLRTALVNELEAAETIIIDVLEKLPEKNELKENDAEENDLFTNAFSAQTFTRFLKPRKEDEKRFKTNEPPQEFIDEKTGHIYVHGDQKSEISPGKAKAFWFAVKEKTKELGLWVKDKMRKKERIKIKKEPEKKELEPEAVFPKMRMLIFSSALTKIGAKIRIFTKSWRIKFREVPLSIFSLPSLARTKEIFKRLTAKEKFIGILIIILVIFIPLAVVKFSNVREETTVLPEPDPALDRRQNLAGEKNIKLDTVARMIYQGEEALLVETMNKEVFIATAEKIIAIGKSGEQSEYSISSDLGKIIKVAPMEDLNMIFLLTDKNKIVSFSPSSKDFKENSISIEEGKNICCIATYLTYLYVIAENDIWRYPRAEGGFGQPVSWLKEEINLGEARDATIDENIYLALEEKALKLFQGKKEEFNIESFQTAINFSRIYTAREFSNLYVLDNITSRIIRFSKNGEILAQYYNDMLLGAKDLAVDEKGSAAFFVTVSGGVAEIEL